MPKTKKAFIHISDIHYRRQWDENHGTVLRGFFKDIERQIDLHADHDFHIILSGDVVQCGDDKEAYKEFLKLFDEELSRLKITKEKRICTPGNHDVSRKKISESHIDHEAIVTREFNETAFNDYLKKCNPIFHTKFDEYKKFELAFSNTNSISENIGGSGYEIDEDIAVYCLNSSIFSSAGLTSSTTGKTIDDFGMLSIETRNLQRWLSEVKSKHKILVTHHPINFLTSWSQQELKDLLRNNFSLSVSGHVHNQDIFHSINNTGNLIELSAPPLFTNKSDQLGYSITTYNSESSAFESVTYRKWTRHGTFLASPDFSGTEDGKIIFKNIPAAGKEASSNDIIDEYLTSELEDALTSFSSQPDIWVEPVISTCSETQKDVKDKEFLTAQEVLTGNESTIIQAPPQFGLTCLSKYLAQQSWRADERKRIIYIDARDLKPSQSSIRRSVEAELKRTGHKANELGGVIVDSIDTSDKKSIHILKQVSRMFPNSPLYVMQTIESINQLSGIDEDLVDRKFRTLHLCSLSRDNIREVVKSYNEVHYLGENDAVVTRVVSDIDTLNIHRTPLSCITVLKASEVDFDESPVNRTEILHRVLFVIFNLDALPTYKTSPDTKDCEYILGYFCSTLIKTNSYCFTRQSFLNILNEFCKEQVIKVDVDLVFDTLHSNNILVSTGTNYCFKFTYWIYYFAAQRMRHDSNFASYILSEMRYTRFPEIIEFYTGIDRLRQDALEVLTKDLKDGIATVKTNCGLPDELNPYQFIAWTPTPEATERMQTELKEGVAESNLPTSIKDTYADRGYDKTRPYNQAVREILEGVTLQSLMLSLCSASRALRNSDFVNPTVRDALFKEILEGWKQVSKVLFVLLPPLSEKGYAVIDGAGFELDGHFGDTQEERFRRILINIPYNIVSWYRDDLYSSKLAPLIYHQIENGVNDIVKHELILLIIYKRPDAWKEQVAKYISSLSKNSFYLMDTLNKLKLNYMYSFTITKELKDMEFLIKMSIAKHSGSKAASAKAISKIPDSLLPERKADIANQD